MTPLIARNPPQPPLKLRGGEGELCEYDRLSVNFLLLHSMNY